MNLVFVKCLEIDFVLQHDPVLPEFVIIIRPT